MNYLGICRDSGAIYEGMSTSNGYRVHPAPFLTPIRFVVGSDIPPVSAYAFNLPEIVFREQDFDPITKIRRGLAFTMRNQSQPWEWYVQDPLRQDLARIGIGGNGGLTSAQKISLVTYQVDRLTEIAAAKLKPLPQVILGWEPFITFWNIISIEHSAASTPLLTLRAHHSLGDVPSLDATSIPEAARKPIADALEKVEASVNRLSPVEVVDRCRDALSIVFGTLAGDMTKDLGSAISAYVAANGSKDDIRSWAGRIVARLHSRGKPNEQAAKSLRAPSDDDAQLAVRCLRLVLVEFGWAK